MGSDAFLNDYAALCPRFNSRSRMGSDAGAVSGIASMRGFNSRSRMGSDIVRKLIERYIEEFQFALPHGERQ